MSQARKGKWSFWNLLRWAVTIGAVTYVVSQITWMDQLDEAGHVIPGFVTLLKKVNPWRFLGVLLAYPVAILIMARRWQWLLQTHDLDPGYSEALRLTWIGLLTNNVFPGATGGDVVKGVCIYRRSPGKRVAAILTVLVDRAIGLVSLMLLGGVAILTQSERVETAGSEIILGVLLAVLLGGIIFFSRRIRRWLRVSWIIDRLPLQEHIRQVDDAIFHFRGHKIVLLKGICVSLSVQIWTIFCVYLIGQSLGLEVDMKYYFMFFPIIVTIGAFMPSIGGLGVIEGQFLMYFSLEGVGATESSALALGILYRIMVVFSSLPGAIPTYREFSAHGVPTAENGEPDSGKASGALLTDKQPTVPLTAGSNSLSDVDLEMAG